MMLLDRPIAENDAAHQPSAARWRPWFLGAVLLLGGLLIFAHFGCHGDEDTELFGLFVSVPKD